MNGRQQFAISRAAFAAVLSGIVLAASATPTLADGPPASVTAPQAGSSNVIASTDIMLRQDRLMDLKGWIITRPGIEGSGYIESVNDSARLSTTLLWHGPENALQRAIVSEGERRGIAVTIRQRKFSRAQILAAAHSASDKAGKGMFVDFKTNSVVAIDPNFDGIVIRGEHTSVSAANRTAANAALARAAAARLGVDVSIEAGGVITPYVATRSNDTSPFNAGGYMISPSGGGTCSSGFGIWLNGYSRTTTARHCWQHDYRARDGSASYGDGLKNSPGGMARVMTKGGYYWMFDGAFNDPTGFKKTVVDYGHVSTGDTVCTSGGNSGVHCDIEIFRMCVYFDDGMGFPSECTIEGHQRSNGIAAAMGDSGGPVFVPIIGTMQVRASGMIQGGGGGWTNCVGLHDGGPNVECSDWMYFTAMWTITTTLGATLRTG